MNEPPKKLTPSTQGADDQLTPRGCLKILGAIAIFVIAINILGFIVKSGGKTVPERVEPVTSGEQKPMTKETKSECIDRVTRAIAEREGKKVVTREDVDRYYAEYEERCQLEK
jgi:hypothetical protein